MLAEGLMILIEAIKHIEYNTNEAARATALYDFGPYISLSETGSEESENHNNQCSSNNNINQAIEHVEHHSNGRNGHESSSEIKTEARNERRRTGGSGTREVHNKLEKNRRAQLKKCFEQLNIAISEDKAEEKKSSNLCILRSAIKAIHNLQKKERDQLAEIDQLKSDRALLGIRLDEEKAILEQRCRLRKRDWNDRNCSSSSSPRNIKIPKLEIDDDDSNSTSTASECGDDEDKSFDGSASNGTSNSTSTIPKASTPAISSGPLLPATDNKNVCFKFANEVEMKSAHSNSSNSVSVSPNIRIGRPVTTQSPFQVGSFPFSTQVVPHIDLSGNSGILSHQTLQLVTQPTVRLVTQTNNNGNRLNQQQSSAGTFQQPNTTTVHVVQAPSVTRIIHQPSSVTSATKGYTGSSSATTSIPITIQQLTVKPNQMQAITATAHHQPTFTAATLNFQTVGSALPVSSGNGQTTVANVQHILATNVQPNPGTTVHVPSTAVRQVITTGTPTQLSMVSQRSLHQFIGPTTISKVIPGQVLKISHQQYISGQPIAVVTTQPTTTTTTTSSTTIHKHNRPSS
ncbi:hypothetical protein CHUAL_005966 [Chamberlinius hualienensis]